MSNEQNQFIKTPGHFENLGARTLSGGLISVGGRIVHACLQLVSLVILARLLSPDDFGLVAIATVLTSFVGIFSELGLSTATVQRESISQSVVSTLFYLNVAAGLVLMLACMFLAPFVSSVFGDERLETTVIALSITILLSALSAQHFALLRRSMKWVTIQSIFLISQTISVITGITIALITDFGYWALVVQSWTYFALLFILSWTIYPWRPGRISNFNSAKSAIYLGLDVTGFKLINFIQRQLDDLLIGWRWSASDLGYYNRAYSLLLLPIQVISEPINSSVIPGLSRLQSTPNEWRELFLRSLRIVNIATFLLSGLLMANAEEIIEIVLGRGWERAGTIFWILTISLFARGVLNGNSWLFITRAQTRRMLKWNIATLPVFILSFVLGLPYGAEGVAWGYSITVVLLAVPGVFVATRNSPVNTRVVLLNSLPFALIAIVAVFIDGHLANWLEINQRNLYGRLALSVSTISIIYLVISIPLLQTLARFEMVEPSHNRSV